MEQQDHYTNHQQINNQKLFRIQGDKLQNILHRSIGALTFLNKNKQLAHGSGFLISKNLVLTAAHNIYDKKLNYENIDFKFYLGANGVAKKYYQIESVRYMQEFKTCQENKRLSFDFALLKLKKQVQFKNGLINTIIKLLTSDKQFLQLAITREQYLIKYNKQIVLSIFGFPSKEGGNFQFHDQFGHQFTLYQYGLSRSNRIIEVDTVKNKISYGISTFQGQSGCPVVIDQKIIAIHVGGGSSNDGKQLFNVGRLIDLSLLDQLKQWCKQLNAHPFSIYKSKHSESKHRTEERQIRLIKSRDKVEESSKEFRSRKNSEEIISTKLKLTNEQIFQIDISKKINLTELRLNNNKLSKIDLTNNINLTYLRLSNNQLLAIDITKNINLVELYLSDNKLQKIDVSQNKKLTHLSLYNNKIIAINLRQNPKLTDLSLFNNGLTAIDLSNNIELSYLWLNNNDLLATDVSRNINLIELWLQNNKLGKICLSILAEKTIQQYRSWMFNFSNQRSNVCQISLSYNNSDEAKCSQLKKQLLKKYCYQENKVLNIHGCKYMVTVLKR